MVVSNSRIFLSTNNMLRHSSLYSKVSPYLRYPVSLSHEEVNQLMCQYLVTSLTNLKYEQRTDTTVTNMNKLGLRIFYI